MHIGNFVRYCHSAFFLSAHTHTQMQTHAALINNTQIPNEFQLIPAMSLCAQQLQFIFVDFYPCNSSSSGSNK